MQNDDDDDDDDFSLLFALKGHVGSTYIRLPSTGDVWPLVSIGIFLCVPLFIVNNSRKHTIDKIPQ